MILLQRILLLGVGFLMLLSTLELIRRRRLREEYSLLWLLTGLVMILFALFPQVLYQISAMLNLYYLTTMQLTVFLFLLLIVLHYSTVISQISERETELAQQVALLTWQVEQLSARQRPEGPIQSEFDDHSLNAST
ncbi:MAG: DUF2304 domain-containing protein [Anaerolineae bacterium]|nr:DUF2304 domain-containing protein [Anaerolineae bacterium]